jgi:conjugative transfer region protein TrbK
MPASAKIAGVAALAGLMLTVAVVAATHDRPAPHIATAPTSRGRNPLSAELARCRTITMPDSGCEAAWEANRRRFFGEDTDQQQDQPHE